MKNFLIFIGVAIAGFLFWFDKTMIGQPGFYECKIGNYIEYNEVQYVGAGGYAFIGKGGDKYYVVKDGKEGPGFDTLYGLKFSPDGTRWAALGGNGKNIENFPYLIIDGKISDTKYDNQHLEYLGIEANDLFLFSPDSKKLAYVKLRDFPNYGADKMIMSIDGNDLYKEIKSGRKVKKDIISQFYDSSPGEYTDEIQYKGAYRSIDSLSFSEDSKDIYYIGELANENEDIELVKNGVAIKTRAELNKYTFNLINKEQISNETKDKMLGYFENLSNENSLGMYFSYEGLSNDGKSYITSRNDWFLGTKLREFGEKRVCKTTISFTEGLMIFGSEHKWLLLFILGVIIYIGYGKIDNDHTQETGGDWLKSEQSNAEKQLQEKQREEQRLLEERKRQAEREAEEKRKEMEIINRRKKLVPENYLKKFLQHAEKRYGKMDKYGNQDKSSLEREINDYLVMIAKIRDNRAEQNAVDNYIRGRNYPPLNEDYKWLVGYLRKQFESYYAKKQERLNSDSMDFTEMSGIDFERYLGKIFEQNGYAVDLTPESGDQGADVIAEKNGRRLVIQAKKYSNPVGNGAVQEVIGAIRYYDGDEGWVITNSTFTNSAKELAHVNGIRLIDGYELEKIDEILGGKGKNKMISRAQLKTSFQGILTDEEMNDYESFKDKLKTILDELTPRQKGVIIMRFGLDGIDIYSIEAVAKEYKISTETIIDIESKALALARNIV